jgi:transglutaminase-like putative cysteine protease
VSGVAVSERAPAALPTLSRSPTRASGDQPLSLLIELPLFLALAGFAMALWARLVEPSSADRMALALGVVCVGAIALRLLARRRPSTLTTLLAIATAAAAAIAALLAAGLPAHLLSPANWDELREQIRGGMGGIEQAQLPYGGADPWVRLTLVLGAPAMIAAAGALAFWPARNRGRLRAAALGVLLACYGVAATLDNPGAEAFWGIVLLGLSVAWLWVVRLPAGRRAPAVSVALAAGVLALPLVAKLNAPAWWDYENWSWFGAERTVSFEWNHDYGPLDWPRDGTTLMTVETDTPLYWKASVLDRFDGYRWQRAAPGDAAATAELRARAAIPGAGLERRHPGWVAAASFEFRALTSDVVIGAGITDSVDGIEGTLESDDGTLTHIGAPLERGEQYSIVSYVPQPTSEQLRDAPVARSTRRFGGSTLLGLPASSSTAEPATSTGLAISMPLWGKPDPQATSSLLGSPYADTYRLALRWVGDARTPYDAVRAIEGHLRRDYGYSPSVPEHAYPLPAFLFADHAGYCQQFAGTMALMLRMVGIPTRVVSGFAPGSLNTSTGAFEVHDFDAHSWVEVYFRGIGWVTFDPTPGAAPAESQRLGGEFATAFRGPAPNPTTLEPNGGGRPELKASEAAVVENGGGGPWAVVAIGVLAALATAALAAAALAWRRRRRLVSGEDVEVQISELRAALLRVGWKLGPRTTLLAIERRATGAARAAIRGYAAGLREYRYGAQPCAPPGPAERRALRGALAEGGLGRRLRALLAIPPGGPARR